MNEENKITLTAMYMNEIQVKSPTRVFKFHWLDRSIALMFTVSLLGLLLKFAGEALAEMVIK